MHMLPHTPRPFNSSPSQASLAKPTFSPLSPPLKPTASTTSASSLLQQPHLSQAPAFSLSTSSQPSQRDLRPSLPSEYHPINPFSHGYPPKTRVYVNRKSQDLRYVWSPSSPVGLVHVATLVIRASGLQPPTVVTVADLVSHPSLGIFGIPPSCHRGILRHSANQL